jgi:hypothetical protein
MSWRESYPLREPRFSEPLLCKFLVPPFPKVDSLSRKIDNIYKNTIIFPKTILRKSFLDIYKCPFSSLPERSWIFDIFVTIKKISMRSPKK